MTSRSAPSVEPPPFAALVDELAVRLAGIVVRGSATGFTSDASAQVRPEELDGAALVDLLAALESVKTMCSGLQMGVTAALVDQRERDRSEARARMCSADSFEEHRAAKRAVEACSLDGRLRRDEAEPVVGAPDSPVFGPSGRASKRRHRARVGVYAEVGLARRQSPTMGSRFTTTSVVVVTQMPFIYSLVVAGLLSEYRAWIVSRCVAVLDPAERTVIDDLLRARYGARVAEWSDRQLERTVMGLVCDLDVEAVTKHRDQAAADARVTVRSAHAGMAWLTALMPVADAVAIQAELLSTLEKLRAEGDDRAKGIVMTQTLRDRVLGREPAAASGVELVIIGDAETFGLGPGRGTAWGRSGFLYGYGPLAGRHLTGLVTAAAAGASVSVRRALRDPATGELTDLEKVRRTVPADVLVRDGRQLGFGPAWLHWLGGLAPPSWVAKTSSTRGYLGALRKLVLFRDGGLCRTPWCGAPARHVDHIRRHHDDGPTSDVNGQGLCVRCNLVKELCGWQAVVLPGPGHVVATTTPTGHTYLSHPPDLVPRAEASWAERPWVAPSPMKEAELGPVALSPFERQATALLAA